MNDCWEKQNESDIELELIEQNFVRERERTIWCGLREENESKHRFRDAILKTVRRMWFAPEEVTRLLALLTEDEPLKVTTTTGQSGPESNGM